MLNRRKLNKKSQIMSILWSAILIFVIAIESIIGLMIIAPSSKGNTAISTVGGDFAIDIYGPVIPIYLEEDFNYYSDLLKLNVQEIQRSSYSKFSSLDGFESVEVFIVYSKEDDSGFIITKDTYQETHYIKRSDLKYSKIVLKILLSEDDSI